MTPPATDEERQAAVKVWALTHDGLPELPDWIDCFVALTRRDKQIAEARKNALSEALTAVMDERLDDHELYLAGTINDIDGDLAYSRAIHDAENAIRRIPTR